jgi:P22 coat protein - gene protein 5
MANNALLTPSVLSKETLVILENNLVAASKVNRMFENQFTKIGSTITVRKPNKFRVVKQTALDIQDVQEPSTSITVNTQAQVAFQFTSQDLTLTIEEFSDRYLKPAAAEIANQIDFDVLSNFSAVNNMVGTPGTLPGSFAALAAVGQRMDEGAVPQDARVLILNPAAYWNLANAFTGLYVKSVAEGALKGFLAAIANFEIFLDQNVQNQTVGAYAGTGVVNGAGQTGSTLVTNGWTASINGLLNAGDVFTIAGVYAINPRSRQSTGQLQNFVVTSTVNSDGSGNASIPIYPAITPAGSGAIPNIYQTVSGSPANLAAITVKGAASNSYAQNLGFVRDAFGLVTVPLELPQSVDFAAREMYKNISLRIIRAYDINNDVFPCRIDVLYGTSTFYPELACRLTN